MKRGGASLSDSGGRKIAKPAARKPGRAPRGARPAKGGFLDWGSAERRLAGEAVSGDRALVRTFGLFALAAAIDGVGHGPAAARAAEIAVQVLIDHRGEAPHALVAACDAALESTRGVVLSLAIFDADRDVVTWSGVGNVEGVLLRWNTAYRRETEVLLRRVGVVGTRRDQRLYAETMPLTVGDTLVFATDGVRAGFELGVRLDQAPKRIAEQIIAASASDADDALVLVARYLGRAGVPPTNAPSPRSGVGSAVWQRTQPGY